MSEPNREAVEAAVDAAEAMISRYRNGHSASCDIARAALGAAAPHLLAAKNAEIAALRARYIEATAELIYLRQHGKDDAVWWANDSKGVWLDKARAALEMSGGVL